MSIKQAIEALESCDPGDYSTGHVIHPSYDEEKVNAALAALRSMPSTPVNSVKIPTGEDEAALMVLCGVSWLKDNAPHRLKQPEAATPHTAPLSDAWISVADQIPPSGQTVLAFYLNSNGKERRVRAQWIAAKSCESGSESDIGEYDEATDTYYDPEGWYEQIDNWDVYSAVGICGVAVTHWMPLPPPPKEPASADQARQLARDQLAWGVSITQGGKRIDPAEVFKPAVVPFEFKKPDDSEGGLP